MPHNESKRRKKRWTPQEVEEAVATRGGTIARDLLQFAKQHSANGQFVAQRANKNPVVDFYISHVADDGSRKEKVIVQYGFGNTWKGPNLYLRLKYIKQMVRDKVHLYYELLNHLQQILGKQVDGKRDELPIHDDALLENEKLPQFKELILWLKDHIPSP